MYVMNKLNILSPFFVTELMYNHT